MLLQANGIGKRFGAKTVLSRVSLQIRERERIGLVGVNGAGKSTLLSIIAGETQPDEGDIFKAKDARIGYLAQDGALQSGRSIRDETMGVFADLLETERELREMEARMADPAVAADAGAYEELMNRYAQKAEMFRERGGYGIEARVRGVLHGMGLGDLPPETPVDSLSGGQKTRLALAKLLLQEPDLLLLDEPTNHLDIAALTWLETYLRGYPGAILVVSHDRYFLDSLVDAIYEIERAGCKRYTGNYTRYVAAKAAEYEAERKLYENQQEEIARMEDFIRRNIARSSTAGRARSRRKMLERMERLDKPAGEPKRTSFAFETERISGQDVLKVEELSVSVGDGKRLFEQVSFELRRGESVALIGPNGVGKSTLLKTLVGETRPDGGSVRWGSNVKIGYYDQEHRSLHPDKTVLNEVWDAFPDLQESRVRTVLGQFLFSGDDVKKTIANLSGGEKARVALAKLMLNKANVLVLDEPTNHLDLYGKEALEAALLGFSGTILFVSHDRYFLNKMAERVLELHSHGVDVYLGNYDDMLEKKREMAAFEAERAAEEAESGLKAGSGGAKRAGPGGQSYETHGDGRHSDRANGGDTGAANGETARRDYMEDKRQKREERNRQRRIERLEDEIARLESDIAALEAELLRPEVYGDYTVARETNDAIERAKAELDRLYEEWESLMS
jgi:ATP-binding cassette subfamily F protein 3